MTDSLVLALNFSLTAFWMWKWWKVDEENGRLRKAINFAKYRVMYQAEQDRIERILQGEEE